MARKPKANPEHDKLIEVLKFTPRTYKVRIWGYGGEYVMGTVKREVYDYFKRRRLDLAEFAWDSDYADKENIPEEMWPFYPGQWHDADDMGHCWGVNRDAGTIQVDDENDDTIYEKRLEEINGFGVDEENPDNSEPEWAGDDEIWIDMKAPGTPVFIGVSSEKGTFFEGDLELKAPFNPGKLQLTYTEIDGNEIITRVTYDGEDVENFGGDTSGKGNDYAMYIAGSNKNDGKGYECYRNMDDINYTMTDWFPKKIKPAREGHYDVKDKDDYSYRGVWTGEKWTNTYNNEQIKIKEWRGIAYDPDEQDLRDELSNMVVPTAFPGTDSMNPWATSKPAETKELTWWTVKTLDKKSVTEVEEFVKDGMTLKNINGFRWGTWRVATNDGNPPEFEFDSDGQLDMNSCYGNNIEEVELDNMDDGWYGDIEWGGDISDKEQEAAQAVIDEESVYELESHGWYHSETYVYVSGPLEISDADGNVVKVVNE